MNASPLARVWADLKREVQYYLQHLIDGDHSWGETRYSAAVVMVILFIIVGRLFEPVTPPTWVDVVLHLMRLDVLLPEPIYRFIAFVGSFFSFQTLRHALPPLLGILWALHVGARYLRDLLELPSLELARSHLSSTLFGRGYPRMLISEGKVALYDPETNPMLKVGGPGWVDIGLGSAALFERVAGPTAVLGAGTHFIRRFEILREAFDLREMELAVTNGTAMTKDGVPLVLPEIRARLRLRAPGLRNEANPYPVSVGAIRRAVYSRKVSAKGLETWPDMVMGTVRSTIVQWIARRRMDELIPPPNEGETAPNESAPYRQELHQYFQQPDIRKRFYEMGAELAWLSVGHIRPDPDVDPTQSALADVTGHDKIHEQLIETWKAGQAALAMDEISDAKAYARWMTDTARAQVQADMIITLTAGLREVRAQGMPMAEEISKRVMEYVTGVQLRQSPESDMGRMMLAKLMMEQLNEPPRPTPPDKGLLPGGK